MNKLLWIIRRVIYGPTYYDRKWERHCWRYGGGSLVRGGSTPNWLSFLPRKS